MRLIIIGNRGGTNVGGCFERAAKGLGHEVLLIEACRAMVAPAWLRRFNWWLRGRRPTRLNAFSSDVLASCKSERPDVLLVTGISPPASVVLSNIRRSGTKCINYLTDDPWNPAHRAPWFLAALQHYDSVFSPRRNNLEDLRRAGCRAVAFLPFAYAAEFHFQPERIPQTAGPIPPCDILFAGGADDDRAPWAHALVSAGLRVALYGDHWDRYSSLRSSWQGHADPEELRFATVRARICLCLVRRANRDGHVMRSFEIPAMGGCILAEDTDEHREIFGGEGECTLYFRTPAEMVSKAHWLLERPEERKRLAEAAHRRVTEGANTYADRLITMLGRAAPQGA